MPTIAWPRRWLRSRGSVSSIAASRARTIVGETVPGNEQAGGRPRPLRRFGRRTSASSYPKGEIQNLADLPNDQLTAIADFLPKTSRALFAVALTAPSASWRATGWRGEPSDASRAIISSTKPSLLYSARMDRSWTEEMKKEWRKVLDRTARREYYEAHWDVLNFVDIEEDLAKKLTDDDIGAILVCIDAKNNLKKLRLTHCYKLVGYGLEPLRGSVVLEKFDASKTVVYKEAVVPLLDSIIDADGNSLRHLNLPEDWTKGKARNEAPLCEFFAKFNQLMLSEALKCAHCEQPCTSDDGFLSCEICCKNRNCTRCVESGDIPMWDDDYLFVRSCDHCDLMLCSRCGSHSICEGCNSAFCELCAGIDSVDPAVRCGDNYCYADKRCMGCRMQEGHDTDCHACHGLIYAEEVKQLRKENEELRERLSSALGILSKPVARSVRYN